MKTLQIKRINNIPNNKDIPTVFSDEQIPYHTLTYVNWSEYPYQPKVQFAMAHDGQNIYFHWLVDEVDRKAVCEVDQGEVWKDSCVEFFVTFDGLIYYNIETNCIGKVLVASGPERNNRTSVPQVFLNKIVRESSLGNKAVNLGAGLWEMSLTIPVDLFHLNSIQSLNNLRANANFYKCGDDLNPPHFLSWNPIESKTPDFHLPQFFGKIHFE